MLPTIEKKGTISYAEMSSKSHTSSLDEVAGFKGMFSRRQTGTSREPTSPLIAVPPMTLVHEAKRTQQIRQRDCPGPINKLLRDSRGYTTPVFVWISVPLVNLWIY